MNVDVDRDELARLRAIETRVRLLLEERGNWAEPKRLAAVRDLWKLTHGAAAHEVTFDPGACTLAQLHDAMRDRPRTASIGMTRQPE